MSSEERLSRREVARLAELELIIERAEKDRDQALLEVHDQRLYRQDYTTFEQYCRERWDISGNWGMRLVRHARKQTDMPIGTLMNEAQTRELERLDPEQVEAVMKRASESGAKVTAKKIKQARAEVIKTEPPKRYMPTHEEKLRRLDEEVRLWSEGYHRNDICTALGISASTLNMDLASRGISGRPIAGVKPKGHPMEVVEWRDQPDEVEPNVIRLTLIPGKAECDLDRESADRILNKVDAASEQITQWVHNGYELTESQLERLVMIRDRVDQLVRESDKQRGAG